MRPFIKYQVFNGVRTSLWNPSGPILPHFGERILYDSVIHKNARVGEVIDGTRWNWPVTVSANLIALKNSCAGYILDPQRRCYYLDAVKVRGFYCKFCLERH